MAAVLFELGLNNRPGLSEQDALDLAEIVALQRNVAAITAADKIRMEARKDPDSEPSRAVELTPDEAAQVLYALQDEFGNSNESLRLLRDTLLARSSSS